MTSLKRIPYKYFKPEVLLLLRKFRRPTLLSAGIVRLLPRLYKKSECLLTFLSTRARHSRMFLFTPLGFPFSPLPREEAEWKKYFPQFFHSEWETLENEYERPSGFYAFFRCCLAALMLYESIMIAHFFELRYFVIYFSNWTFTVLTLDSIVQAVGVTEAYFDACPLIQETPFRRFTVKARGLARLYS